MYAAASADTCEHALMSHLFSSNRLLGTRVLVVARGEERELATEFLAMVGAQVAAAGSLVEAQAAFERELPSILVCALADTEQAAQIIEAIRARPAERGGLTPAIAVAGGDGERLIMRGYHAHLPAPADPIRLVEVIDDFVQAGLHDRYVEAEWAVHSPRPGLLAIALSGHVRASDMQAMISAVLEHLEQQPCDVVVDFRGLSSFAPRPRASPSARCGRRERTCAAWPSSAAASRRGSRPWRRARFSACPARSRRRCPRAGQPEGRAKSCSQRVTSGVTHGSRDGITRIVLLPATGPCPCMSYAKGTRARTGRTPFSVPCSIPAFRSAVATCRSSSSIWTGRSWTTDRAPASSCASSPSDAAAATTCWPNAWLQARPEDLAYLLSDSLERMGAHRTELVAEMHEFWRERFFADAHLVHDVPVPGALEFARACYDAGALLLYVTGRDLPLMGTGTFQSLRDLGFPIGIPATELVLKPDATMPDDAFKRLVAPDLARVGRVVAAFDNEPANCNVLHWHYPDAQVVHVATQHAPGAPPLAAGVSVIADFLMV